MNSQFIEKTREFTFTPIGEVQSCFTELFGIPRQPGLAPSAAGKIWIYRPFANEQAFLGLEKCSHVWLQFVFHANDAQWRPKVRPPRLGGNEYLGVFATRSPNRPNPIGLSVVSCHGWARDDQGFYLHVSGLDLLNGTPILDIKPYVPYADSIADAYNHVAPEPPPRYHVFFSEQALAFCAAKSASMNLEQLIREILQQDPRPQYQRLDPQRIYGMHLLDVNIRWRYVPKGPECGDGKSFFIEVMEIAPAKSMQKP